MSKIVERIDSILEKLKEQAKSKGGETDYKKFFNKKLKEWNINSPQDLSPEDRKKFFNEVEKEWTGEEYEEGDEPEKKSKKSR
jgi:hypothetical protein